MKTLTAELLAELGASVTRPGYLVQLGYSATLYLSTMGDISHADQAWSGADVKLSGLSTNGAGSNKATLALGNTDGAYGALVLNEGASDIEAIVWACYAGATATGDVVQVFAGVVDGADISAQTVTLQLAAQRNKTLYCPRVFIAKPTFNFLQPAGTKIVFGGETFVLERV
jgi:hypothetical protein